MRLYGTRPEASCLLVATGGDAGGDSPLNASEVRRLVACLGWWGVLPWTGSFTGYLRGAAGTRAGKCIDLAR